MHHVNKRIKKDGSKKKRLTSSFLMTCPFVVGECIFPLLIQCWTFLSGFILESGTDGADVVDNDDGGADGGGGGAVRPGIMEVVVVVVVVVIVVVDG